MSVLPEGWVQSTVGEVCSIQLGRQRSPKNHQGPHMRPYLRSANVTWRGIDVSDVKEMNFDPTEVPTFELAAGDILLNEASGSPGEVGKPAVWRGEVPGACFQNTLLRVRSKELDERFLYWHFYGAAFSGRFGEAGRGVNIRHLGKRGLETFPLPVPPLPEQRRIVAAIDEHFSRLDAAEAALQWAARRRSTLERAIFSAANDAQWPELLLGDLLDGIEAGKSFKTPGRPAEDGEWGVVKVSAMTWGEFDASENKAVLDTDRIDPRYQIVSGDLLLSRANTSELVGATVLVGECPDHLLLSDKSMRLMTKPGVDRQWLRYCLGSPELRAQMSAVASGTSDSMRNISQAKVRELRVRMPPLEHQRRLADLISQHLGAASRLSNDLKQAERRSAALRRSVLAAAFTGRLVPQDPTDEPASVLLERIAAERAAAKPPRRKRVTA